MDIREIEDRAGEMSGVNRTALAQELGISEQTLSRVINGSSMQVIVPGLLEFNGQFTATGLEFMRELFKVGDGLNGGALGKERSRFIHRSRKNPQFEALYRSYRYKPQEYDIFPVEVVEDQPLPQVDDDFGGAITRFQGQSMACREMPDIPDLLGGYVGEDSLAARLARAVAEVHYREVYGKVSSALSQSSQRAASDAMRDHSNALAAQLDGQS